MRRHGVDLTPPGLVVDLLLALARLYRPRAIWDPCAGPGIWGQVCRHVWPDAALHGSDLRPEETGGGHYDSWRTGSAVELEAPAACDLILTNPEFPIAFERHEGRGEHRRDRQSLVDRAGPLVDAGGVLALLGTSQVGQRGDAVNIWSERPPSLQLRVCAPCAFRGGSATDSRDYSLWVWGLGGRSDGWTTVNVPAGATIGKCYRWESTRPGDGALSPAHVTRIALTRSQTSLF